MKKLFTLVVLLTAAMSLQAQTGTIYSFAFQIDDELITQTKVQNKEHKILNVATMEDMPRELSDTILLITEQYLDSLMKAKFTSMVPEEKLIMGALPEHLLYMPMNSFKGATKKESHDFYVNITCHVAASGGTKITLGVDSYSKVKPKVTLNITVYDAEKTKIQEKSSELKDFEKLRSHTFETTYGVYGLGKTTDEVTKSETLTSDDILRMFVMALEAVE